MGHKEMPPHALKLPDAWGCVGPWAGTMSWEVNGVTAKPQPDLDLGTSGGEKEKRLL